MARKWLSRILLESIPTYLIHALSLGIMKVGRLKRLLRLFLRKSADERVWDILDAGSNSRFSVMTTSGQGMIVHNCLSNDYGAGAKKKWKGALLKGFTFTLEEMQAIHTAQQELHQGIADFRAELEREWQARGGWVLCGLGFPTPVDADKKKDLNNRVIQKTGHNLLVLSLYLFDRALEREGLRQGVDWIDIVRDFHDQYIRQFATPEKAARGLQLWNESVAKLNQMVGATVKLKAEPKICKTMSHAKIEEKFLAREKERADAQTSSQANQVS